MCLYPKLVLNPKYLANKKNGGYPPKMRDSRLKYVAVGCGQCMECRKQKANEWKVRLTEELKVQKEAVFVTLTFAPEELQKLIEENKVGSECNAVAGLAVRRFLERYRKRYKKSIRHWLITELGQDNSERIHLHGILFKEISNEELSELWHYGHADRGYKVDGSTISYIVKYVTKIDEKHKTFKPQMFVSAGIGKNFINSVNAENCRFDGKNTFEAYKMPNGTLKGLPIYYRNKLYTEEQREQLWLNRMDKQEIWINGLATSIKTKEGVELLEKRRQTAQELNKRLGFGDDSKEWKREEYNVTLRMLNKGRGKR